MSRVLLIDDEPAALELRRMTLQRIGHQAFIASDGNEARRVFSRVQPDVVLLDLRIPEAEVGLALIREFRFTNPSVRIVVLCGYTPDIEGQPEELLVDRILAKPVRSEVLVAAIG